MPFRSDEIALEALRGVRARFLKSSALAFLSFAVGGVVIWFGFSQVHAAEHDWIASQVSGASSFVVRATSSDPMSSSRCDELRTVEGVESAGSILRVDQGQAMQTPSDDIEVVTSTPGFTELAFPGGISGHPGVTVTKRLGEDLGLRPGSLLEMTSSGIRRTYAVTGVSRSSSMITSLENAVIIADAGSEFVSECDVTARPGARDAVQALLSDWFPQSGNSVIDFLRPDSLRRNPTLELQNRVSIWSALLGAAVCVALSVSVVLFRKQELAIYRILGLQFGQLIIFAIVETAVLVWLPASVGMFLACVLVVDLHSLIVTTTVLRDCVVFGLSVSMVPLIMSLIASVGSPFDVFKER